MVEDGHRTWRIVVNTTVNIETVVQNEFCVHLLTRNVKHTSRLRKRIAFIVYVVMPHVLRITCDYAGFA